ncbi:MAG TPA: substrate-binding domain-containing protein [Acidisoma sp.]|jgi:simple sugar transport system substrate-binding protein|uniref:substrate-binding domain-containing protein n=1 Tax=Acidisoma sp. TaxID=1872115 RepID=UPI002B6C03D0|nr:substrate-binding domain-containing protein [Acidisoma sp.]HTI03320.1 substrate-binding domain-containing protein [Acidisoma sp.]
MKKILQKTAVVSAAIAAIACTVSVAARPAQAAEKEFTFAMITHAQPGDTFWDIIRKGANAAAKKDHVKLLYLSSPTASGEAQLVNNVVSQHVEGIALTLAFPDAEAPAAKAAMAAGIPVIGFNAGGDAWKDMGILSYVGQDETIAGKAVGERLNKEGAKSVVCVDQQQGAVQLEARCDGIKSTFKGSFYTLYVPGYDMASAQSRIVAKLQQDKNVDYVVTLGAPFAPTALQAVGMANSQAKVGTFDLTPRAVGLIQEGKLQWAVDQQPFVEGYLAIDFLWLNKVNGDVVGGGQPVLTGPAFVDKTNIADVAKFAKGGTR